MCGDLFHIGHLQFLEKCKQACDFLIVGVISDEGVARYKRKPIIPLAERMRIIGALKCVDRVVAQNERDPTATMKNLAEKGDNIQLLFHGSNWHAVPGTEFIEGRGGKLFQPPYYELQSTTNSIKKIRSCKQ